MTYDHHREQTLQTFDILKEDDEGFFTASSSSGSESEKEVSSEDTLLLSNSFCQGQEQESDSSNSDYMEATNEPQESEKPQKKMEDLEWREKPGEMEQEVSSPARRRLFPQKEGLSLIGELESGLSSLNHELDAIFAEKGVVGERKKNRPLQRKFSNLEKLKKEMDEELAKSVDGVEGAENGSVAEVSKLIGLVAQVNNLKLNVNYLNARKDDSEEKKAHQNGRIKELENKLEDRGDEFSDVQNEMSTQIVALTREVSQLQQETDLKRKLDEHIDSQQREISRLDDEKETLQAKILEMEIALTEKEDGLAILRRRLRVAENEASAKLSNLSAEISYLQQQLSDEKQTSKERLTHLENQNSELISKLSDQQEILKQQEDTIIKLREESKLVKGRFLQAADRKMDEVAEEFRKNFEDKLRILSQRIRVAEQLHVENKDNWKRTKERCEQEHPALEKRLEELLTTGKAELWKMSEVVDEMMKGMELIVGNFERKERSFKQRISRVSDDIQVSKNWVKLIVEELKPSKTDPMPSPFAPMDDKEREKMMEEKVQRLDAKVKKERADKLRLMRGMYELHNKVAELEKVISEKDEGLVRLSEEKVEAIRQLCVWIDYHQGRFDHLKELVLVKRNNKSKGRN